MSRSDRLELESRFIVILVHLLKTNYAPEREKTLNRKHWANEIVTQRRELGKLLDREPSLKRMTGREMIEGAYSKAAK